VRIKNSMFKKMLETRGDQNTVDSHDDVFSLSDPQEVHSLMRSLHSKEQNNGQFPGNGRSEHAAYYIDADGILVRFKQLETRIQEQDYMISKEIGMLIHELTSLRDTLKHQVAEQKNIEYKWKNMIAERDQRLMGFIKVAVEQQLKEQLETEVKWRNEIAEREQKVIELMQKMLGKANDD